MAPNDCFRNQVLQYNLLEDITEREEFMAINLPMEQGRPTIRIAENISIVLDILPPDFERCLMIQAQNALANNEIPRYVDPQPSNLSLEEARSIIRTFITEGLLLANEAIGNRQFIEQRLTELLLLYCEPTLELQHRLV